MRRFLVPVTLLLITLVSCKENPPKPEENTDNDSICTLSVSIDESPITPQKAALLFDVSVSMKGYLNSAKDSRFQGVISNFLNIANNTNVHLFGTKEEKAISRNDFEDLLTTRKINWSQESNIIAMVETMKKHANSGNDVCFLVTDAILSGSNKDISNSPGRSYNIKRRESMSNDLLSKLQESANSLSALIIRYKANFDGVYSCYNNSPKKMLNKERPFFVIALGKWEYIKFIESRLKNAKMKQDGSTPYSDILMIGDKISYSKLGITYGEGLKATQKKSFTIKNEAKNIGEIELKSTNLDSLPDYMQEEDYLKDNIELYVKYNQQADAKLIEKDKYTISLDNNKNIFSIKLKPSIVRNCDLTLKLKYELPKWVTIWSDDDDTDITSNVIEMEKTFNLRWLVRGFTALNDCEYVKVETVKIK